MPTIVKITNFMSEELIDLDLQGTSKDEILKELSSLIGKSSTIMNQAEVLKALSQREELGSTGIGKGIAIPHAKTDFAESLTVAFGMSRKGVDFKSLDGNSVNIFFVFASPLAQSTEYLKVLARISRLIRNEGFRQKLINAATPKDVIQCINNEETI